MQQSERQIRIQSVKLFIASALMLLSASTQASETYTGKLVQLARSPDSRPCFFFTLDGVGVADPAIHSTSPWFAISTSATGYKEMVAMILMARVNQIPVNLVTTGGGACGHAEATGIEM